jgi:radical SAM protein with 4Fe4S-binding SPASM domain
MIKSIGAFLAWSKSPLEYPWRCLSGGRLRIFSRRLGRLRRLAGQMVRFDAKADLPVRLQIETTDTCNMKCIMCTREVVTGMNSSSISLNHFMAVVEEIDPFYVTMNGLGEPLLDKSIFEKLKFLHERQIITSMPTNGTYVRRANLIALAENLPDILQLSIDGATKESFESIRKLGEFESIIDNYRAIAIRRANGETRSGTSIRILCSLQKNNMFEYKKMFALVQSIPGVTFNIVPVFSGHADGVDNPDYVPAVEDVRRLHADLDRAICETSAAKERQFYLRWKAAGEHWLNPKIEPKTLYSNSCVVPWFSTYIDAKGRVYPCCYLLHTDHVMGNLHEQSFVSIWNGETYQDFRRKLIGKRTTVDGCRTCPRNDDRTLKALSWLQLLL